jgi:hypothetical protein
MSRIDDELKTLRTKLAELEELKTLRNKLASLEEQKRIEPEVKARPLESLENIAKNYRQSGEYHERHKRWQERAYAIGTAAYLEHIIEALKQIQERLCVLEQK